MARNQLADICMSTTTTAPINDKNDGSLELCNYRHNYKIDETDVLEGNLDFTEADINLPQLLVPTPPNSPFADAISSSTMNFMAILAVNNHLGFTQLYKDEWKAAKKDFSGFIDTLGHLLYTDIDEDTSWKNITSVVRRPFKTDTDENFKGYYTSLQTDFIQNSCIKGFRFGYYLSVEPGNQTTVSVGMETIPPVVLDQLRHIILKEGQLLGEVLSTEYIKQIFGVDGIGTDLLDTTRSLRHVPDEYPDQHLNSDLLRHEQLLVIKRFNDIDVVSPGFLDKVLDVFAALAPFMDLLCEWEIDLTHRLQPTYLKSISRR